MKLNLLTASLATAALLFTGCSSKSFTDAAVTKPIHVEAQDVSVSYAAAKSQRELYQPYVQAALFKRGIKVESGAAEKIVVAPLYIGDYMVYNNPDRPVKPIPPLSPEVIQGKIEQDVNATQVMADSLYYRFSNAADFSSVNQYVANLGASVAGAALMSFAVSGIVDADGWQMVTDVYVNGERTRVFAHTFDSSLDPNEAVLVLMKRTADQIADIVTNKNMEKEGGRS